VWVAFAVEQRDDNGEWFGNPVPDDWVLDAEPGPMPDRSGI
jgi:hypothetical protein